MSLGGRRLERSVPIPGKTLHPPILAGLVAGVALARALPRRPLSTLTAGAVVATLLLMTLLAIRVQVGPG